MRSTDTAATDIRTSSRLCQLLGLGGGLVLRDDGFPTLDTALQLAELLCQSVVEEGYESALLLLPDGQILFANPALAALLGHRADALDGRRLADLMSPVERLGLPALLARARAAAGRSVSTVCRLARADGSGIAVKLTLRDSPLTSAHHLICGVRTVDDVHLMPSESVATESHALALVDASIDGIVSIDVRGRVVAFNRAAERLFGWCRDDVMGREANGMLAPPGHRETNRQQLARYVASSDRGVIDSRIECPALHADGHEFPVEITVAALGEGDALILTAFVHDISQRTQLVADLCAAATRLAAVVQAHQQLAVSDAGPDELVGQIAEFARELLDGEHAVFEPVAGLPLPGGDGGVDTTLARFADVSRSGDDESPTRIAHGVAAADGSDANDAFVEWPLDRASCLEVGGQSWVAAPLHAGGRTFGLVKVRARAGVGFLQADAHALELFAAPLGAVVHRREADRRRRIAAGRQAQIVAMQREFSASDLPLAALMELMAQRAETLTEATGAAVEWIDGAQMVYVAASGAISHQVGMRLARDGSLSGKSLALDQALVCDDTTTDPRVSPPPCGGALVRSIAVVPLRADSTVIGTLKVVSPRVAAFGEDDMQHLQILAETMASIIHRRRAVDALAQSETQYRMLFESNPHPMWVTDVETQRFVAVNAAVLEKFGYTEGEFLSMSITDFRASDGLDIASLPVSMKGMRSRHRCKDGSLIDTEASYEEIRFAGRPARLSMAFDVSQRLRAETGQARAARAQCLLSACNAALVRIEDEEQLLDELCRIAVELGGYRLVGIGYAREADSDGVTLEPKAFASSDPAHAAAVWASWREITKGDQCPSAQAVRSNRVVTFSDLRDCDDQPWRRIALDNGFLSAISLPLRLDGRSFGFFSLYADQAEEARDEELALLQELADNAAFGISAIRAERERRHFLSELAYGASHDAVTGLERYALLEQRLTDLVAQKDQVTSVALLDLDRFNSLNETLGHDAADLILRRVGERLLTFADDRVLVAHLASDEFVIVMSGMAPEQAALFSERLRAAVALPIDTPQFAVMLTATVGISHSPAHGSDARDLVRRAQAAMERGKRAGRDCSHAFLTEQMQDLEDRALLGARLRLAVDGGEMRLHYQPQYAAASGELTGFEALLRWHNAELGAVSPGRFIPIAETLGLMPVLGGWVVHEACRQARAWLDAGHCGFRIAVNVSGQQLMRPGLVEMVTQALREFALPPQMLDLELTESSLMENVSVVQGTLAELKSLGVSLSLDDFGTGYSSLAYLKHFSLDKLKIDQSFVRGLPDNPEDAAIARTIVSMGHQLRLLVSAEGVENRAQAEFLRGIGCDELQGYHFGHPVNAADAERSFLNA